MFRSGSQHHGFTGTPSRAAGFTLVELGALLVVVIAGLSFILPVLGQQRMGERKIQCQNNLRQLGVAAAAYRADHKGGLFYDVPREKAEDATRLWDRPRWWESNQIGAYQEGLQEAWWTPTSIPKHDNPLKNHRRSAGMVRGALLCPADQNAVRSYHFNMWASSANLEGAWWSDNGVGFNIDSLKNPSAAMIFGEAFSVSRVDFGGFIPNRWATFNDFGKRFTQFERFAGVDGYPSAGFHNPGGGEHDPVTPRYDALFLPTEIATFRHSAESPPKNLVLNGELNYSFADGSVFPLPLDKIVDIDQKKLTGRVVWSEKK